MNIYYDESIFTTGLVLENFKKIGVENKADEYLVKKHNKIAELFSKDAEIRLNPKIISNCINIYTLNKLNKMSKYTEHHNMINVLSKNTNTTPIYIGEHEEGLIYDVGSLTSFESALMIKYFAINHVIFITRRLFRLIEYHFRNNYEVWFNFDNVGVIQNELSELIKNGEYVDIPNLDIYSTPVTII